MIKRIFLILLILILAASFFYFDLNQLLTLDGLKGSMAQFNEYKAQSPLLIIGGFSREAPTTADVSVSLSCHARGVGAAPRGRAMPLAGPRSWRDSSGSCGRARAIGRV